VRVIVSGYYGFGNAGDEAVLAGIIAGMTEAAPGSEFVVLSGDPGLTAEMHRVRSIPRFDLRGLRGELAEAGLLISGGGSLFQDATSARSCLYYLHVIRQALKAGVPVIVLGQGIGPLRRRWLRALVGFYLRRVLGVAVRDSASARELERLGVKRSQVRVAGDLSLAMPLPDTQAVTRALRGLGIGEDESVLAVAPRTWRVHGASDELIRGLASAVQRAAAQLQPQPRIALFPMQRPQDDEAARAIADAVGGTVVGATLPPPIMAGIISTARVVVAMRLHALIFAAMGGTMPVAISYDPKVDAFMSDLGLRAASVADHIDHERIASTIVEAWNADAAARGRVRQAMEERRAAVRAVFRWAAETARRG
jgi:polysaccharide pyruvyl transferase CsaB